jgi:hypothetical protein
VGGGDRVAVHLRRPFPCISLGSLTVTKHHCMVDKLERKRRKWHGQQVKNGLKRAKVQKLTTKKAAERLRKTSKGAIVKHMFSVKVAKSH